ncbi:MAG: 16S rRNA (uracil(1498)-N(3))-methyltransferase [Candidatus Omnitrophota bacterium]|nr:16S rRNA (uracil(1498)-N(3))-methyltransferase [Candidatus Omnitrophota bacterium]
MSRFYVPKENVGEREIVVNGKEAHHILDVMRMQDGDEVVVFDGTGKEYTGFIKDADRRSGKMIIEIVRQKRPAAESIPEITLAQAVPKQSKIDYIIEKATELGVSRIVPLITERTIVRPDAGGSGKKLERWRKIAVEASKQCGRTSVPKVEEITDFKDMVKMTDRYDLVLLACLAERSISIKDSLSGFKTGKVLVFIGPEGDFTPEERRLADRDNCRFVSLGRRVLRSDTAGLFVLSVLNYEYSL